MSTINVTASSVSEAAHILGLGRNAPDIGITWRRGDRSLTDFGRIPQTGCVVDARCVPGEEVPRAFETSGEALRYIARMLKKHDAAAREQQKVEAQARKNSPTKEKK